MNLKSLIISLIWDLRLVIDSKFKANDSDEIIFWVETSISFRSISYCDANVLISPIKIKSVRLG